MKMEESSKEKTGNESGSDQEESEDTRDDVCKGQDALTDIVCDEVNISNSIIYC